MPSGLALSILMISTPFFWLMTFTLHKNALHALRIFVPTLLFLFLWLSVKKYAPLSQNQKTEVQAFFLPNGALHQKVELDTNILAMRNIVRLSSTAGPAHAVGIPYDLGKNL